MASAELSRRLEKVVGYPPLVEIRDLQHCDFHEALLDADSFEDLPGQWQAAILKAERTGPTCGGAAAVTATSRNSPQNPHSSDRPSTVRCLCAVDCREERVEE
jgi:hypothetical protein